jgi:hypothetical protein
MGTQTDTTHQLTESTEMQRRASGRSLVWWVAAGGAAAGIVSLALRRKQSRWQMARRQAGKLAQSAATEWKPLVGAAAAAGTAAIAYRRRSRPAGWQTAMTRAGRAARDMEVRPWMTLAASTAIGLVSAYRGRGRAARRPSSSDATVEKVAAAALRIVNRAKRVSREAARLYPQMRKAFA